MEEENMQCACTQSTQNASGTLKQKYPVHTPLDSLRAGHRAN